MPNIPLLSKVTKCRLIDPGQTLFKAPFFKISSLRVASAHPCPPIISFQGTKMRISSRLPWGKNRFETCYFSPNPTWKKLLSKMDSTFASSFTKISFPQGLRHVRLVWVVFPQFPQGFFHMSVQKLLKSGLFFKVSTRPVENLTLFQQFPHVFHRGQAEKLAGLGGFPHFPQALRRIRSFLNKKYLRIRT